MKNKCKHPPHRLYAGNSNDFVKDGKVVSDKDLQGAELVGITWVGCCECGELLGEFPR